MRSLREAVAADDVAGLRKASTAAADATALDDGEETFCVALVSYVLSKLISKQHYWDIREKRRFMRGVQRKVAACEAAVAKGRMRAYMRGMHEILSGMRRLELADARFVSGLESKGRTKLAARLYARGFSLSKAVSLTSTNKRDLLAYSGRTLMVDRSGRTKPLSERLRGARAVFSREGEPKETGWVC